MSVLQHKHKLLSLSDQKKKQTENAYSYIIDTNFLLFRGATVRSGQGLLSVEVFQPHSDASQSVGLL